MSKGIESGAMRAHGESAAVEEAKTEVDNITEPIESDVLDEERKKTFRTLGFSRMRTSWNSDDRQVIQHAQSVVEGRILANFADAYQVMHEVYDLVRTPSIDEHGEIITDQWGFTIWKKTISGSYEEDWTALTLRQKQNLLFTITTRLFDWEQRAADAWGEAMFSKAQFEERFALGFDEPMSGTVDDRRAHANIESREERYFAIFLTIYSKRADSIVRVMGLLGQRIKDTMV